MENVEAQLDDETGYKQGSTSLATRDTGQRPAVKDDPQNTPAGAAGIRSTRPGWAADSMPRQIEQLRSIPKSIDEATRRQANDVAERVSELLCKMAARHLEKYRCAISVRLIMLGTMEENARPSLVVFCDSVKVQARLKRLICEPAVIAICRPGDQMHACFDIYVGPPLIRPAAVEALVPIGNHFLLPGLSGLTMCGTPIWLIWPSTTRRTKATLGGALHIEYPSGDLELFGLTVAHVVENPPDDDNDDGGSDDEVDPGGASGAESLDQNQLRVDPAPQLLPREGFGEDPGLRLDTGRGRWGYLELLAVNRPVLTPTLEKIEVHSAHDWALIRLTTDSLTPKPNMLIRGQRARPLKVPTAVREVTEERAVLIMTGSSGIREAMLSPSWSRMLIHHSGGFVRTYLVELSKASDISEGDSGSWVIDSETLEVYGHVVAVDALGGCYVIPLLDVFADVEQLFPGATLRFPQPPSSEFAIDPLSWPGASVGLAEDPRGRQGDRDSIFTNDTQEYLRAVLHGFRAQYGPGSAS